MTLPAHPDLQPGPQPDALAPPRTVLVWQALVQTGARQDLGCHAAGPRYLIPILGGSFQGWRPGAAQPDFGGRVLPGGADRQWLRPDGIKELDALYEMQTDDGAVLTVRNRVWIDEAAQPGRYVFSHVRVSAPEGPHAWLNRRVFVGTLTPLAPAAQAVCIRVWQLLA